MMAVGVYDVPKVRFQGTTVATNTTPTGPYRGAGRPEATQLIERVLDVAADQLNIDPAEIRRRNFLDPAAFPLTTITGAAYDSGEYEKALDAALKAAGYEELRAEQALRRAAGDPVQLGIGVSAYVEVTAPARAPHRVRRGRGPRGRHGVDDGRHELARSRPSHRVRHGGQRGARHPDGQDTADQLRYRNGAPGRGNHGLAVAADRWQRRSSPPPKQVLSRAQQIAAHELEASPEDVVTGEGGLQVAGVPGRTVQLARARRRFSRPRSAARGARAGTASFRR